MSLAPAQALYAAKTVEGGQIWSISATENNVGAVARLANDVSTLASGDPRRIARRAKNKIVGRALGRAGLWRLLWR